MNIQSFFSDKNVWLILSPVSRKLIISDRDYFIPSLIYWSENLCEMMQQCVNKTGIFLILFSSHLFSDQKLAKSRLFLAKKKSSAAVLTARPHELTIFYSLAI